MIEKIMKAVKRGNKKRSINITIGAVVGFLLSCTAVMGADEYLRIIESSETIKFSTDNGSSTSLDNPYSENNWDGSIYINNITLSGTDNDYSSKGYGLKLGGNLGGVEFINNGSIAGTATENNEKGHGIYNYSKDIKLANNGSITGTAKGKNGEGYGIYNYPGTIENLANNGSIVGTAKGTDGKGHGIYNYLGVIKSLVNNGLIAGTITESSGYSYGILNTTSSTIESLVNNGLITGSNGGAYGIHNGKAIGAIVNNGLIAGSTTGFEKYGYGIRNERGTIESLVNNGSITGTTTGIDGRGYGIYNYSEAIKSLANNGTITGTTVNDKSYGIYNDSRATISALTNTGVIYGKTSAVLNRNGGTTIDFNNYGLLISEDGAEDTVKDATLAANEGLIFKAIGGSYTAEISDYSKFGTIARDKEVVVDYGKNSQAIKKNIYNNKC